MSFHNLGALNLLWVALAFVGLIGWLELRSRGALSSFLSPAMQQRLTAQASVTRIVLRLVFIFLALAFAIFALVRPQMQGETEVVDARTPSADVMFLLDTSRSMLAEDTAPNRLVRAKAEIGQMLARLEGQRVGIVAFAGRASLVCPLTPDHSFFTTVLNTLDTRSAGRGGTKIGDAMKIAVRGFPKATTGAKLIVLITDGDDQDPYSEEAAKQAAVAGVKVIAIGLGSEQGSTITITDPHSGAKQTLEHDGQPVISKLNADQLKKIAKATEGVYIPAGTSALDLDSIVDSYIKPLIAEATAKATRRVPAELFQGLVALAIFCLMIALWIGSGAGDRKLR
ncbi:MAG TPA: VWA domain-containing protein [Kofleriaceae bacterium]|jgi:Ca-activated chloride channel family protein